MQRTKITLTSQYFSDLGARALIRRGTSEEVADRVIRSLLRAEYSGYQSHGVLRLVDYLHAIDGGQINPRAFPQITSLTDHIWRVDGGHGFGQLAAEVVSKALISAEENQVRVISLIHSGHVGRLADIVATAAQEALVIGCCNYMGFGLRVAAPSGVEGCLCTNPIVLAVPCPNASPIILDMTTSHVSEGKVRQHWLAGQAVPVGWLRDKNGNPVTDPGQFYAAPPRATMIPLGGEMEHKGFGLALFVEILAGVMTGGGHCGAPGHQPGNAGVFARVPLSILGRWVEEVLAGIKRVIDVVKTSGTNIRIPGWREQHSVNKIQISLELHRMLLEKLC